MLSPLARALRLASFVLCLIVVASFALFAINQTSSASAHQQDQLSNGPSAEESVATAPATGSNASDGSIRKTIDEAAEAITSPFSPATDRMSSQWLIQGTDLVLALLVYGFGVGFLARTLRVRA